MGYRDSMRFDIALTTLLPEVVVVNGCWHLPAGFSTDETKVRKLLTDIYTQGFECGFVAGLSYDRKQDAD